MDGYCLKSGQGDGQVFLKEKKVALVIGNCYAHPQIENLNWSSCYTPTERNFSD